MVNGPAAQAAPMANAYELVSSASSLRLHAGPQGEGAHRAGSALEAQTRRAISSEMDELASVRRMPCRMSSTSASAPSPSGWVKLGHPLRHRNWVSVEKMRAPHAAQR